MLMEQRRNRRWDKVSEKPRIYTSYRPQKLLDTPKIGGELQGSPRSGPGSASRTKIIGAAAADIVLQARS